MIVAHPTLPMLVTAHENGFIRIFDLNSGAAAHCRSLTER
jgi:striatin 1/3/4